MEELAYEEHHCPFDFGCRVYLSAGRRKSKKDSRGQRNPQTHQSHQHAKDKKGA